MSTIFRSSSRLRNLTPFNLYNYNKKPNLTMFKFKNFVKNEGHSIIYRNYNSQLFSTFRRKNSKLFFGVNSLAFNFLIFSKANNKEKSEVEFVKSWLKKHNKEGSIEKLPNFIMEVAMKEVKNQLPTNAIIDKGIEEELIIKYSEEMKDIFIKELYSNIDSSELNEDEIFKKSLISTMKQSRLLIEVDLNDAIN